MRYTNRRLHFTSLYFSLLFTRWRHPWQLYRTRRKYIKKCISGINEDIFCTMPTLRHVQIFAKRIKILKFFDRFGFRVYSQTQLDTIMSLNSTLYKMAIRVLQLF